MPTRFSRVEGPNSAHVRDRSRAVPGRLRVRTTATEGVRASPGVRRGPLAIGPPSGVYPKATEGAQAFTRSRTVIGAGVPGALGPRSSKRAIRGAPCRLLSLGSSGSSNAADDTRTVRDAGPHGDVAANVWLLSRALFAPLATVERAYNRDLPGQIHPGMSGAGESNRPAAVRLGLVAGAAARGPVPC